MDFRVRYGADGRADHARIVCTDENRRILCVISMTDIAQHDDGWRVARTVKRVAQREIREPRNGFGSGARLREVE